MRNVHKFALVVSFSLTMVFTLISCDDSKPTNSNLVGAWEFVCDTKAENSSGDMEFFKDGTGIANTKINEKDLGIAFKWQFRDGNRLQITSIVLGVEASEIYDVELSEKGTILTFIDKEKNKEIYSKKSTKEGDTKIATSSFTDTRDNKKYKTVKIGDQTWFAENLNFEAEGSKCYDNDPSNCEKYGRLYNWETAMKICPTGWHLPTNEEWDRLYRHAEGRAARCSDGSSNMESPYKSETAGKLLKATSGWNNNGNGVDKYGFAALPGGFCGSDGKFNLVGYFGDWWSASEINAIDAYSRYMGCDYEYADWGYFSKPYLFSVRCVKD